MVVQIRIGEAISFWEMWFWLLGQVNTQKCMPIWLFTHVLHFLTQWKLGELFSFTFLSTVCVFLHLGVRFLHLSPWLGSYLVILSTGLFHSRFVVVFSLCMPRKSAFVLWSEWTTKNYDFGLCSSRFGSCNGHNRCWIRIAHSGLFFPILIKCFWLQNVFPPPRNLYLAVCASFSLVSTDLEWNWLWTSLINLV